MAAPETEKKKAGGAGVAALLWVMAALSAIITLAVARWAFAGLPVDTLLRPWLLSRGIGIVAYLLLWASVVLGLLQSMGLLRGITRSVANVELHDFVSMAAIYATLFHALILIFDHPEYALSLPEVLLPFAAARQPLLMAYGIVAMYLSVIASLTTYMRGKMSPKLWRTIHLSSLVGFLMALAHGLFMGSESQYLLTRLMYMVTGGSTIVLVLIRVAQAGGRKRAAASSDRGALG